jgi:S1-C subfamily serine protease
MAKARRLALSLLAAIGVFVASEGLGQTPDWPWLGVVISDISDNDAESLGSRESGSLVVSVEYAGPALAAGLRRLDIIVAIDGRPASNTRELTCIIQGRRPGDVVLVTVVRAGKSRMVPAKLGRWPDAKEFPRPSLSDCGRDKVSALAPAARSPLLATRPSA